MDLIGFLIEMQSKYNEDFTELGEKINSMKGNSFESFKYVIEKAQENGNNEPLVKMLSDQFRFLIEDTKRIQNKIENIEDDIREIKNMQLTIKANNETKTPSQDFYDMKNKKRKKFL